MVYEFFNIIKLVINTIIYFYMVPHNHMLILLFTMYVCVVFLHTHIQIHSCIVYLHSIRQILFIDT